jgi:hypothetical protein
MRRAVLTTIAAIAALFAGCASKAVTPKPLPASATLAAHGVECHKERATGSLIDTTVCTSAAEREREAGDTQQTKDWLHNQPAGACQPSDACH